jgi:hypothetical protein
LTEQDEGRTYNKCIAGKWGRTIKLQQFASLYFGSGWTEFCWAFSRYLVLLFLYWASVPGWTINNALPAQSPVRKRQMYSPEIG